jgi:formylglycine-generating enzyme required for sulfatase activity
MMGNAWEWCESPFNLGDYSPDARRLFRGGNFVSFYYDLESTTRMVGRPNSSTVGFRVAPIPEPASAMLLLMGMGGLILRRKK